MSRRIPAAVRDYASDVACLACIVGILSAFFVLLDYLQ